MDNAKEYSIRCRIARQLRENPEALRCADCAAPVEYERRDPEAGPVFCCPRCGCTTDVVKPEKLEKCDNCCQPSVKLVELPDGERRVCQECKEDIDIAREEEAYAVAALERAFCERARILVGARWAHKPGEEESDFERARR
jgi:hypothetical protein